MSDTGSTRSIAFWRTRKGGTEYIHVIATSRTEDPDAPVEIVRPFGGHEAGDEVLVSLTRAEWAELIGFIDPYIEETDDGKCPKCGAEEWLGDGDGLPYICAVCGFEETT